MSFSIYHCSYSGLNFSMIGQKKTISVSELKRLLYELYDKKSYVCVRIRLIGEMWQQAFLRIFNISDEEVVFSNESNGKMLKVKDLSTIMQFELDYNFQQFLAHFHYDVSTGEA